MTLGVLMGGDTGARRLVIQQRALPPFHVRGEQRHVVAERAYIAPRRFPGE